MAPGYGFKVLQRQVDIDRVGDREAGRFVAFVVAEMDGVNDFLGAGQDAVFRCSRFYIAIRSGCEALVAHRIAVIAEVEVRSSEQAARPHSRSLQQMRCDAGRREEAEADAPALSGLQVVNRPNCFGILVVGCLRFAAELLHPSVVGEMHRGAADNRGAEVLKYDFKTQPAIGVGTQRIGRVEFYPHVVPVRSQAQAVFHIPRIAWIQAELRVAAGCAPIFARPGAEQPGSGRNNQFEITGRIRNGSQLSGTAGSDDHPAAQGFFSGIAETIFLQFVVYNSANPCMAFLPIEDGRRRLAESAIHQHLAAKEMNAIYVSVHRH